MTDQLYYLHPDFRYFNSLRYHVDQPFTLEKFHGDCKDLKLEVDLLPNENGSLYTLRKTFPFETCQALVPVVWTIVYENDYAYVSLGFGATQKEAWRHANDRLLELDEKYQDEEYHETERLTAPESLAYLLDPESFDDVYY